MRVALRCTVLALILVSGGSAAAAAPPNRVSALLAQARRQSKAGDHTAAAALLVQARAAEPANAEVLSELGWQLFLAKDYPRALEATQAAAKAATTPNLKAASLYNLGRIDEALGRREEAAGAYQESLKQRPNRTVQARLAALAPPGPATAATKRAIPLAPPGPATGAPKRAIPLEGPFSTLAAWCAKLEGVKCDAGGESDLDVAQQLTPHAPYQDARVFVVTQADDASEADCAIAIRLASGWYARRVVEDCKDGQFRRPSTRKLELGAGPAGATPTIDWTLGIAIRYRDRQMQWMDKRPEEHVISCGIGPSQRPSCGERSDGAALIYP